MAARLYPFFEWVGPYLSEGVGHNMGMFFNEYSHLVCWAQTFAPLFSARVWPYAQALLLGAIMAPGKRTVCSILRVLNLGGVVHFQKYHRVLNRAQWSALGASRRLLCELVQTFAPRGPLVLGIDETLERRWGQRIAARGIYRDAARSSKAVTNKTSGLRWLSVQLLAPVTWAQRIWALPFLTVLAPSARYYQNRGRQPQNLTDRAQQVLRLLRHWIPQRALIVVADGGYAVLDLLARAQALGVTLIVPLRLDAALFAPAPARPAGRKGRPALKGRRLPTLATRRKSPHTRWHRRWVHWYGQGRRRVELTTGTALWYHSGKIPVPIRWVLVRDPRGRFETRALLSTDPSQSAQEILELFTRRWQVEVTFEEARAHLGLETQRQWNEKAIQRTTPVLLGLFSVVTLMAHHLQQRAPGALRPRAAAWYSKSRVSFSDALACVRDQLWKKSFCLSVEKSDSQKLPERWLNHFADLLCYAQ
jgi:hypothetical protein